LRRRLTLWGAAGLLVFCVACGQPAMSRNDARTFAREALTRVGFTGVRVSPTVTLANYRSPDRRFRAQKAVQVWRTHSTVSTGSVDLYVPRKGNSAVFVRDEATAGGPLLTDRQFKTLQSFRLNPAQRRRRDRLETPTIAAVVLAVVVACALFLAYLLGATERGGPPPPPPLEDGVPPAPPSRDAEPGPSSEPESASSSASVL
jgi:hypothetical protein